MWHSPPMDQCLKVSKMIMIPFSNLHWLSFAFSPLSSLVSIHKSQSASRFMHRGYSLYSTLSSQSIFCISLRLAQLWDAATQTAMAFAYRPPQHTLLLSPDRLAHQLMRIVCTAHDPS